MTDLNQITDVYGDKHFDRSADLAGTKTLLPMFKKDGSPYRTGQGFPMLRWTQARIR
jgi:hypothetical protein